MAGSSPERAGFGLVVEAGLGAGIQAFKNFSLHTFPSSLQAATLWKTSNTKSFRAPNQPAYDPQNYPHLDECGLYQLASKTIGVPFVGLTAATLAVAEIVRRLHGGIALELLSGSVAVLDHIELLTGATELFEFGYTDCAA